MEYKNFKRINWNMLLSHHAECDSDRTLNFGKIKVCSRCFGMLLGFIIAFLYLGTLIVFPLWLMIVLFLFMQSAGVDFLMHELHIKNYQSSNIIRITTGFLFGLSVGISVAQFIFFSIWSFLLFTVLMFVYMEIVIAWAFSYAGHLNSYLEKYEYAVYKTWK